MRILRIPLFLLVLAAACRSGDHDREIRPMAGREAYRPRTIPIGWTAEGRLLVVHQEMDVRGDAIDVFCGGSGVYEMAPGAVPRAVFTGERWCDRAWTELSDDPDLVLTNRGRTLYVSAGRNPFAACGRVERLNLVARHWGTPLVDCDAYITVLDVAPDGRWMILHRTCSVVMRGGEGTDTMPAGCTARGEVRLVRPDGTQGRKMAPDIPGAPVYSPDGRRIAFAMTDTGGGSGPIEVLDVRTGRHWKVADGDRPAWSPDGRWLAYRWWPAGKDRDPEIRIVRAEGGGERTLFVNRERSTFSNGWTVERNGFPVHSPVWWRDGRSVVFTRFFGTGETLWRVNVDGTGLVRIADVIPPG